MAKTPRARFAGVADGEIKPRTGCVSTDFGVVEEGLGEASGKGHGHHNCSCNWQLNRIGTRQVCDSLDITVCHTVCQTLSEKGPTRPTRGGGLPRQNSRI